MSSLSHLDDIQSFVVSVASLSNKLSAHETSLLPLLVEGTKLFLKTLAEDRLQSSTRAALLQYSSDCTPQKLRQQHFEKSGSVVWQGSFASSCELYVQQLFGTTFAADGSLAHFLVFKEPVVLAHGKTMAALLACTLGFPGLGTVVRPREGITIFHVVQDRGMSPSYRHALSGWMSEETAKAASVPGATSGAELLYWHTEAPCCLHAAHNSLKWSAEQVLETDASIWKALHVALNSYRACMHAATAGLGSWLQKTLEGRASPNLPAADELRSLYAALGLSASSLDSVCDEIRLTWSPSEQRLYVLDTFLGSEGCISKLSVLLLSMWKVQAFTLSRWLTVGTSCRQLALAAVSGFLDFMGHLRTCEYVTQYESSGTLHLNHAVLRVAIVLGVIAYVPECLIGIVLGDCRLLHVYPEVQEGILQEIDYLERIPFQVWARLAGLCNDSGIGLRHAVVQGALTALGHMEVNIFSVLVALPWSLANGPVEEAMSWLKTLDSPPAAGVARQAFLLLRAGFGENAIAEAITMLKECSFAAYFSEKMHASTANVAKYHPEYGPEQLCNRAFVHLLRFGF